MGDDWVVDSLVGFLQSSTWRYPVDNFIEQNCTGKLSGLLTAEELFMISHCSNFQTLLLQYLTQRMRTNSPTQTSTAATMKW